MKARVDSDHDKNTDSGPGSDGYYANRRKDKFAKALRLAFERDGSSPKRVIKNTEEDHEVTAFPIICGLYSQFATTGYLACRKL